MPLSAQFTLRQGESATLYVPDGEKSVVNTAAEMLQSDFSKVFSSSLDMGSENADIVVGTLGADDTPWLNAADIAKIKSKKQAFLIRVLPANRLAVVGSDAHGTAYGLLEVSRLIGVSPWEWWADATPSPLDSFKLPADYCDVQYPSVEYRGIFINDEDWGLMPWSSRNYELTEVNGRIGPKTNARIFELLLRLRANYYWPAMHECTEPFFLTPGNREMAAKYGIYIGGSHCEPMASSTAVEWGRRGKGDYDYVNNRSGVIDFWEDRLKDVANQEIVYTLGMRGVHDGQMNGAKTVDEQRNVLSQAIADQRALLAKYVNPDVEAVPQVFIPYKEVLDVYRSGLQVPDDVCLMWCDDNYGYIRQFPTEAERSRKGGNGVYYHASYWGRPHDYLWLGTFSPYLMHQQMKQAYDNGIQRMWILNVGDIKPIEYQTELFLDMAWNINKVANEGVTAHMTQFLQRELGDNLGSALAPIMQEHYRLAYIRKPEFMGNTRTEEWHTKYYDHVRDLPWSQQFIETRLHDYAAISDTVQQLAAKVDDSRKDTYFQLVQYPVQAAAQMNVKTLNAQLARHGLADWKQSEAAYDSIVALTSTYNEGYRNNGKWRGIMDHQPRKQPVFEPLGPDTVTLVKLENIIPLRQWNAIECTAGNPITCEGLGYEGKAAAIAKGSALQFDFENCPTDSIAIELAMLPNHPLTADGALRVEVSVDGIESSVLQYNTHGRSEQWKDNVLRNQAIAKTTLHVSCKGKHSISIKAIDDGIVLDQVKIFKSGQ